MAFDPVRDEIVTFGGWRHTGPITDETWIFKGGRWAHLHPAHVPPARDTAVLVFDAALGRVVMYGGRDVPASATAGTGGEVGGIRFAADTWTWSGSDWTEQHPAHRPVLFVPDGTYDYVRNQLLLLGFDGQMETWTYDGTAQYAYSTDGGAFTDIGPAFRLTWSFYRGDRLGLFSFNDKSDGGFVDFDNFECELRSPG